MIGNVIIQDEDIEAMAERLQNEITEEDEGRIDVRFMTNRVKNAVRMCRMEVRKSWHHRLKTPIKKSPYPEPIINWAAQQRWNYIKSTSGMITQVVSSQHLKLLGA